METEAPLPRWFTDLLAHRRWVHRTRPFPHVYVREVFVREFYDRLATEFTALQKQPGLFRPIAPEYGATGVNLWQLGKGPLELFMSRAWHDLITAVAGVPDDVTGDVEGSLHHHDPDSPRGWPHSDLAPAWFPGAAPGPDTVGLPGDTVDLKTGERPDGVAARELVRAVAVLFYLGNPEWQPGQGGETALFSAAGPDTPQPVVHVPPLNNSMIVFECTPRTWHTFAGDNTGARNSLVMWLHRPRELAVRRQCRRTRRVPRRRADSAGRRGHRRTRRCGHDRRCVRCRDPRVGHGRRGRQGSPDVTACCPRWVTSGPAYSQPVDRADGA
jgi:hypothetical protein